MQIFTGKTAVITGGASGIGRAMADRFAGEGMNIVLADIEKPALDRAVEEMKATGVRVAGFQVDALNAKPPIVPVAPVRTREAEPAE